MGILKSAMSHAEAAAHLREEVSNTEVREIKPLLYLPNGEGEEPTSAYFSVVRAVFCEIEYLGALYDGWNGKSEFKIASTKKSIRYIDEVLAAAADNQNYAHHAHVIYEIYRAGTVHLHAPKVFINSKVTTSTDRLGWALTDTPVDHLSEEAGGDELRHLEMVVLSKDPDLTVLPVSVVQLYEDLLESVEHFASLVEAEATAGATDLIERWRQTADALSQPMDREDVTW